MYKLLFLCLLLIGSYTTQADITQYSITVPAGTSTVVAPPRALVNIVSFTNWGAETSIAQGAVVCVTNDFPVKDQYYMALVAGDTGTTAPTNTIGQLETNGTALLIHCYFTDGRTGGVFITQEIDAQLWYHQGSVATTNGGQYAYLKGQQFRTNLKGPISVYSDVEVKLNIWDQ